MSALPADFFSSIGRELAVRTARATVSQLGPANNALLRHLQRRLERNAGEVGGLVADPVFEAMFGWPQHTATMDDLTKQDADGRRLLHPDLVTAMDEPSRAELRPMRFERTRRPYVHQVRTWQALLGDAPRSVVVSTGTGSGKTECFLVPILNDLATQAASALGPLQGVQALFLYPLNALINSQRDRLRAWTTRFGGKIRFGLYNGVTPNKVRDADQRRTPEEVLSRKLLRADAPPILVTNHVMLEFMLVRAEDSGILAQSRGKLRWIVLDEAHTYVGSQAAEISLLLRRVLHAFDVEAKQVRFVATSATIGEGEEARKQLKAYMARLAGVDEEMVDVVDGKRLVPALDPAYAGAQGAMPDVAALRSAPPPELYDALARVPAVRRARDLLANGPRRLSSIAEVLGEATDKTDPTKCLTILDAATRATKGEGDSRESLLPMRGHFFLRTTSGLWACCDPACSARTDDLRQDWRFGAVYLERHDVCACGAKVFELVFCQGCGAEDLSAVQVDDHLEARPIATWLGTEADAEEDEDLPDEDDEHARGNVLKRRLIQGATVPDSPADAADELAVLPFDPKTASIVEGHVEVRLTLPEPQTNRLRCLRCGQRETPDLDLFRPVRLGSPFYLAVAIPSLLENVPAADKTEEIDPRQLPFEGRRLITFTDSRQGTARFAIKAQLEAERNYLRSYVYHTLWSGAQPPAAEVEALEKKVERFTAVGLTDDAAEARSELHRLQDGKPVPWLDLRVRLEQQPTIHTWMRESQRMRYFAANLTASQIAKMFLLREFARRPKRMNSLETLGLAAVQYPFLVRITDAPDAWRRRGRTLEEWRSFLKLGLDFVVRSYTAISVEQEILRWMGTKIAPKRIAPPGTPQVKNRIYAWPSVSPTRPLSRMGKMLARALKLDERAAEDRGLIDILLKTAWDQVRAYLRADEQGYVLDFEDKITVALVREAWICPITRRLLDTTLLGVSPYQTDKWAASTTSCERVTMPSLRVPFPKSDAEKAAVTDCIANDAAIAELRQRGVWTEFSDRIASGAAYLEVGEHSAQQKPTRLRELETLFKSGRVNVLSCSTTMEMGVDIGGVCAVAMNNAPPGPANFFQRAGRAGRRGETAAASLTLCQSAPHGEAVFRDPLWPFTAPIHVPVVSLSSDRIVMRHVASLAFAAFLASRTGDALRLRCAWFFEQPEGADSSPAEDFSRWLVEVAPQDGRLEAGLRQLVRGSNLAMTETRILLTETAERLQPVVEGWLDELQALKRALDDVGGMPKSDADRTPEQTAVLLALRRMRGEYLLKSLASNGFLPAYGFPIDVVAFDPTTLEEAKAIKKLKEADDSDENSRDDTLGWKNSLPSRDLGMAIREYAPGSGVAINGMVYQSGGITLNWQLPPNEESGQPQIIRWAYECKTCGTHGTSPTRPDVCKRCSGDALKRFKYLRPSGFAVDFYARPHNDVSQQRFVPAEDPWITAAGVGWEPLPRPEIGRYRYDPDGMLFHRSSGVGHWGYAICLKCGRAASETGPASSTSAPEELLDHAPLRGRFAGTDGSCAGSDSPFALQRNVHLGGEQVTDVYELQLKDPASGAWLADEATAMTLAVALREAVARRLGIDAREIGWSATVDNSDDAAGRTTIILYDTAGGGAGYAGQVASSLPALLRDARRLLDCPRACDQACHGCLLRFDTQHAIEKLDRRAGVAFLTDTLLEALAPPPDLLIFGSESNLAFQRTLPSVLRAIGQASATEVRVYLGGDAKDWDRHSWEMTRALVSFAASPARKVHVFLPKAAVSAMEWDEANDWADWAHGTGVVLRLVDGPPRAGKGFVACEVLHGTTTERFGVLEEASLVPGDCWGSGAADERCVRAEVAGHVPPVGSVLDPAKLRQPAPSDRTLVEIGGQLNGAVGGVGRRFFDLLAQRFVLLKERLASKAALSSIEYRDRYMKSPLTVRLLFEVLRALRDEYGAVGPSTSIRLEAVAASSEKSPYSFKHDWRDAHDQQAILKDVLGRVVPHPNIVIRPRSSDLPHDRELKLTWTDGKVLTIALDQGIGFLEPASFLPFHFERSAADQAKAIVTASFMARAHSSFPVKVHLGAK